MVPASAWKSTSVSRPDARVREFGRRVAGPGIPAPPLTAAPRPQTIAAMKGRRFAIAAGAVAIAVMIGTGIALSTYSFPLRNDICSLREKHSSMGDEFDGWLTGLIRDCISPGREVNLSLEGDRLVSNGTLWNQLALRRILQILREGVPAKPESSLESSIATWDLKWRKERVGSLLRQAAVEIRKKEFDSAGCTCTKILKINPNHRVAKFWLRDIVRRKADSTRRAVMPSGEWTNPDESEWREIRYTSFRAVSPSPSRG
jgi:hypothetical protein